MWCTSSEPSSGWGESTYKNGLAWSLGSKVTLGLDIWYHLCVLCSSYYHNQAHVISGDYWQSNVIYHAQLCTGVCLLWDLSSNKTTNQQQMQRVGISSIKALCCSNHQPNWYVSNNVHQNRSAESSDKWLSRRNLCYVPNFKLMRKMKPLVVRPVMQTSCQIHPQTGVGPFEKACERDASSPELFMNLYCMLSQALSGSWSKWVHHHDLLTHISSGTVNVTHTKPTPLRHLLHR